MDDPATLTRLLARAESGDDAAWNEIVDRFTNLLWSVTRSYRLADDKAIDVIQTTWMRLVENLGRIHDPERLAGWLATTARRECLRILRRSGREDVGRTDTTVPARLDRVATGATVDLPILTDERNAQLWGCFSRLSERCQRLLRVLMAADPPAYAEVSAALGLPHGSIGPTRMRCLDQLRKLVDQAGYGYAVTNEGSA